MIETKVYQRGQTTFPSEFRKEHNLTKDDVVVWDKKEDGTITVSFRKKVTIDEMIGSIKTKEKIGSVKLVRGIYKDYFYLILTI